ncbi:hypothetical protein [Flavobacterium psychrotolerans]|uniref:Uncharacterized protein n=1 Tax=Flavobacterium psychrotolerans TaxID=2169410 RepID=A0A2U1JP01_9FLAO|nr:hypothetical protein [Flavobacterium psychrotolerans]PWA06906.1 hypothetical protein DB895_02695 [Flavobacterium psychrotolerans]
MKPINEILKEVKVKIKNSPLDLKLLFLFSFLMTIASIYIHLGSNKDLYRSIIPYTGWSPGQEYLSLLFFIPFFSQNITNLQKSIILTRRLSAALLGISLISGIIFWTLVSPEDYTNPNPYLRYDSLTPIFTIALPLFWILILGGFQLKDYFNNKNNSMTLREF